VTRQNWDGVANDELESILPYANFLLEAGDAHQAEALLRRGVEMEDTHCAFNLFKLLTDSGRAREAEGMPRMAYDGGDELAAAVLEERAAGRGARRMSAVD
jgi:hypothetical protein